MSTQQLLLHLPDELIRRLKRSVPPRRRSKFIQDLLEEALPPDGVVEADPLYQAALAAEEDDRLAAEMAEWEPATIHDGVAVPAGEGVGD
jgi:hypothetical protein